MLHKKCLKKDVPLDTAFPGRGVASDVETTHAAVVDDGVDNGSSSVW